MPKRSSKAPKGDLNTVAFNIVAQVTGEKVKPDISIPVKSGELQTSGREKNPAAVALGRLGGMKGGKARAESLTKAQRKAIARKAAISRWKAKQS